ncbi:Aste57867_14904 [Aphanomyces stellatus]|uniref:Aste57867_14904 protein n=1 Tax=Aphanomyces stellatus TaxID=120398 RepID=A0A485L255_9STRA|nr:hypothetical protein As57867_014848 [Aphanomyces stellatus]VFT91720.1 Aste57867_14904 [Aphanomyces stellatus]
MEATRSGGGANVFKLAIIGGGPAGIGILVRAARLGYLPALLEQGVLMIHSGPVESVGTGNLGEYIINSNTFAKSLVSSVLEEKPELDPPESIHGTFLEPLSAHPAAKRLMDAGNATIGLSELGKFLAAVGGVARLEMLKYPASSTCLVHTTAVQVERVGSQCKITTKTSGASKCYFAEHVALAMGGKQEMPPPDLLPTVYHGKTWLSDNVLRDAGRVALADVLAKAKDKKVCIVGGSHSAFSVAWTLLHKMPSSSSSSPSLFHAKDITMLHRVPVRCYYGSKKEAEADGVVVDKIDKCGSVNTFTGLREDAKALYRAIEANKEARVRLFHLKKPNCPVQTQAYDHATAIVWCCGYGTNMIPIVDIDATPMAFSQSSRGGAVEVDLKGRLMRGASREPIDWLFGIGVGFSLRAAFDEMRTETRADGVTVYHRRGATLILAALFGHAIYGADCTTFEQMVEKCERRRKDDKTKDDTTTSSSKIPRPAETKRLAKHVDESTSPPATPSCSRLKEKSPSTATSIAKRASPHGGSSTTMTLSRVKNTSFVAAAPSPNRRLQGREPTTTTGPPMLRRSSFGDMRRHTSHSSLRIDVAAPSGATAVASVRSCGKPTRLSVAGGAKEAIQGIRSARCGNNQQGSDKKQQPVVVHVESS